MTLLRRDVLKSAFAIAATSTAGPLLAQDGASVTTGSQLKGPRVWLDLDQAQLDAAYTQVQYAPNQPQILQRYAANSEVVRQRLGKPRRVAYGPSEIERLDIYLAQSGRDNAPINVFLHGGAWRNGLAKDYAFAAEMFVLAGAHLVIPDFVWVQDAGGRLEIMAEQVFRAIAWVHNNARAFGGDPARIYISGHSSGAHLAAVALTTDWQKRLDVPADTIKGALCCSGIYDLRPVRLSARSNYVKFTDQSEEALSPQRHIANLRVTVVLACGSLESPEYQRQARDFAAAVTAVGKPVQLLVGDGYNHFEVIETMANPYGLIGRAVLAQMNLA